jgi:AraC family transcriptional regulator, L-rhamnose operon regulatory protein RhaS
MRKIPGKPNHPHTNPLPAYRERGPEIAARQQEALPGIPAVHAHRVVYQRADDTLLPEVPMIGHDRWDRAEAGALAAHAHRGLYEICYLVRGSVDWWAEDSIHEVGPGEVYVTRPGERHGGLGAIMHPCELYWVHVRIPASGVMSGLTARQTRSLASGFGRITTRAFAGSPVVGECFAAMLAEHARGDANAEIAARALLHQLLVTVLRSHERQESRHVSALVSEAIDWMGAHLAEEFSIDDVADAVGLSVSQLHQRFVDEVGFTPADYRMTQRMKRAKQLLRERQRSITEIAMDLGFSTSQYFATAFKNRVGMTPRTYRRFAGEIGGTARMED